MTEQTRAQSTQATPVRASDTTAWWTLDTDAVVRSLGTDAANGLTSADAARRLATGGPNTIAAPPAPSAWTIALRMLADPMNLMLVAVVVVSLIIAQFAVAFIVAALIVLNVVLGTRQELAARASVDGLSKLQIPHVKVVRDGSLREVPAPEIVPGRWPHPALGEPADPRSSADR
jgi:Ca2+-transporting ATPase